MHNNIFPDIKITTEQNPQIKKRDLLGFDKRIIFSGMYW